MAPTMNHNRKHDIRNAIPKTKFTDPEFFPQHVHRDFPLMLLRDNVDFPKKGPVPVLDEVGNPVVVEDESELETFLGLMEDEDLVRQIRSHIPSSPTEQIARDKAALDNLMAENERLTKALEAATGKPVEKPAQVAVPKPSSKANKLRHAMPAPLKANSK